MSTRVGSLSSLRSRATRSAAARLRAMSVVTPRADCDREHPGERDDVPVPAGDDSRA